MNDCIKNEISKFTDENEIKLNDRIIGKLIEFTDNTTVKVNENSIRLLYNGDSGFKSLELRTDGNHNYLQYEAF